MPDWTKSMQQTFEYYVVDPDTWGNASKLDCVTECTVEWDGESATFGSASISCTETLDECYIRAYLITIQNGVKESYPLGTFMVETPSDTFDGRNHTISLDAYTPLLELKDNSPPLGYSIPKGENIMNYGVRLSRENCRAPVVPVSSTETLSNDFVAETDEAWLSYISDLVACAKYQPSLDEMGRILFAPVQDIASLQPVWTYNDDNSSLLYPDVSLERDMYGIPNVVEVLYSTSSGFYYAKVVNDDETSPISTVRRGREIVHRVANPTFAGNPTQSQVEEYARQTLRNLSSFEYRVSYSHGYCPPRIGDCVRLNYKRAGLIDVKAKVVSQSIKCVPGCPVSETAVFTVKLWKG